MEPLAIATCVVAVIIDIPLFFLFGKMIFKDWEGFGNAIAFWFQPDTWSLFRGEYWEDFWAEMLLGVFFALCGGLCWGEYMLFQRLFA